MGVRRTFFSVALVAITLAMVTACSDNQSGAEQGTPATADASAAVFIKAEPAVNAVLERSPRSLRVYLTALPNIERSSLQLFGPEGEIPLRGFHTMGADDLMIEIEKRPIPNGIYTVQWTARFGEDDTQYQGNYQFTVAVPEQE